MKIAIYTIELCIVKIILICLIQKGYQILVQRDLEEMLKGHQTKKKSA